MHQLTGNCLIGQSGGPTSAINASLCGIIEQSLHSGFIQNVYGAVNGIEGILKKHFFDFGFQLNTENDFELLKTTPAAYLGSCRYKLPLPNLESDIYKKIFNIFQEFNIRYFFYIGGNDSMDTVMKLSEYAENISFPINIIGVPKTIDNDLVGTDHTPGFGSSAKFIATSVLEITRDSCVYDVDSVTIIEIMGRNAGWLTAASALARCEYNESPDLIYLPEVPFSIDQFISDIKAVQARKRNVIVAVSEGIKDIYGNYIFENKSNISADTFGHATLGGTCQALGHIANENLNCKVRAIELNVLQRCAMHMASKTDLDEAFQIGKEAVKSATKGDTGKMMVFKRVNTPNYTVSIESVDIRNIANLEKTIPRAWINEAGNDITPELIDYMKPLIQGEIPLIMHDGLPVHLTLNTVPLGINKKRLA